MSEERLRSQWNQTSSILAAIINSRRDPKKSRPVRPEQLNPFVQHAHAPVLSPQDARSLFQAIANGVSSK